MKYYEYGGMKFKQNTKSHICDDSGRPLCGVKSNWMEAGQQINDNGFVKGSEHIGITIYDEEHKTCRKCLNKYIGKI